VLATSRRPLHLPGEQEQPVGPLDLPRGADTAEVAGSAAAQLFVQQAGLVRPGFTLTAANAADVGAVCARLDGLPLAIELAASRVKLLAPKALLARLGNSLGLAATDLGRPSRQQTLRHTIAWSYDLLEPGLAGVFRRMGVFAGGCELDALAAVALAGGLQAGADPLELAAGLADASLIVVTEGRDGEPRLGMLETVREYALERLEQSGELDDTRRRHAAYYAGFAEQAAQQLQGPAELAALDRLETEHDNLRAALSWSLPALADGPADDERADIGLRLAQALAWFWYRHGHATEGRRWLEQAAVLVAEEGGAPLARVTHQLAGLLNQQGEYGEAIRLYERNLAIWRDLGDRRMELRVLNNLGSTYRRCGDLDTARSLLQDAIAVARQIGSDAGLAAPLTNLGLVELHAGNLDRAAQAVHEALALHRKRADPYRVASDQQVLAMISLYAGRIHEARDLLSAILGYVASSGDAELLAGTLETAAATAGAHGDGRRAARLTGAAEAIRERTGIPLSQPDVADAERLLAPARASITPEQWASELDIGRALTQQQAVSFLRAVISSGPDR
jgi:predicted ATPase